MSYKLHKILLYIAETHGMQKKSLVIKPVPCSACKFEELTHFKEAKNLL